MNVNVRMMFVLLALAQAVEVPGVLFRDISWSKCVLQKLCLLLRSPPHSIFNAFRQLYPRNASCASVPKFLCCRPQLSHYVWHSVVSNSHTHFWMAIWLHNKSEQLYCPCCPSTEITASQSPRQCVLCHSTKPTLFAAVWSGLSHPPMRTLLWWLVGYLCL